MSVVGRKTEEREALVDDSLGVDVRRVASDLDHGGGSLSAEMASIGLIRSNLANLSGEVDWLVSLCRANEDQWYIVRMAEDNLIFWSKAR